MKRWFLGTRRRWTLGALAAVIGVSAFIVGFKPADTDYFFQLNKSIDIFGRVYKEVSLNYVDQVDPQKFMESGIDGLLGSLDPYTNFIDESEGDEIELITTGMYGGIGVTIGVRDGFITVISCMDGYSAAKQGLLPGDRILEIDGKSLTGMKPEDVRSLTRGEPGSEMHVKIDREDEKEPLNFTLTREEIELKNVTYSDFIDSGIGYIKLERFSRGAGNEVRLAIQDLKLRGTMKGIVLDLRDNPGGLLEAAVEIVSKFVPKGSLIVSTKGRKPDSEKKYYSMEDPLVPDVPLIVIVNRNSASASEIVAGAIQDLDRGVILGTRSFGKGLVQTVVPLSYNTQLKITTAKYYTPSGRCIQEIDYSRRDNNGAFAVMIDSVEHDFKTLNGRLVHEHGGIAPDTLVDLPAPSVLNVELIRRLMYFKFATEYVAAHKSGADSFVANDALLADFKKFLDDQKFTYEDEGEKKLDELSLLADKSNYGPSVREEIGRLKTELEKEKSSAIEKNRAELLHSLNVEIMSRYKGDHGRIAAGLQNDRQIAAAEGLFAHVKAYSRMLSSK